MFMEYVYIGKIVDTHGIKGELRIRSDFEKKNKIFKKGISLYIGNNKIEEKINTYRVHKEFDMVTFLDYDNINQVLKYLKEKVYVNRSDLELDEEEYLLDDLIGMEVIENEEVLGKIVDYVYNKNNILLVVSGKYNFYIPYQGDFIINVDVDNKKIFTENAKGLII